MKLNFIVFVMVSAIFACKKPENITKERPLTLNGTWQETKYMIDSNGISPSYSWTNKIQFRNDSVIQINKGLQTSNLLYGTFELSKEDTSFFYEFTKGVSTKVIGKKILINFTKSAYIFHNENDRVAINNNFAAFRKSVFNIVNNDSIFAHNICCTGLSSLIRIADK